MALIRKSNLTNFISLEIFKIFYLQQCKDSFNCYGVNPFALLSVFKQLNNDTSGIIPP